LVDPKVKKKTLSARNGKDNKTKLVEYMVKMIGASNQFMGGVEETDGAFQWVTCDG